MRFSAERWMTIRKFAVSAAVLRALALALTSVALISSAGCTKRPASPWEPMKLGTSADLRAVWFEDSQNGWVAGGGFNIVGGIVGRTRDGGKTWRFTSNLVADGSGRGGLLISGMRFIGQDRGIISTIGAGIHVTADGGENWSRAPIAGGTDPISDMMFLGDSTGWAAGDNGVWQTTDHGAGWQKIAPPDREAGIGGRAVHFVNDQTGWLAGANGSLLRSDDGGITWERVALPLPAQGRPTFWDIHFADQRHGWVVGDEGTIFATRDGGQTWLRQGTGVADAQSRTKLESITVAGGKTQTIDAGDRTPGLTLSAARFTDASTGWLAGYYPNHGRSLILHTQDGGASWRVEADIAGEDIRALHVQGGHAIWAVGSRTREGPQFIHRRALAAAPR